MPQLIRVTDETTEADLYEALSHLSECAPSEVRTRRCDAVLDEVLERRVSATR